MKTEEVTERVVFMDSEGQLSRNLKKLTGFTWVGYSGGTIGYTVGSKTLTLSNGRGFGVADISYLAEYETLFIPWPAWSSMPTVLLVVFEVTGKNDVLVHVVSGAGDAPAVERLKRPLATSVAAAELAGKSWLCENQFNYDSITFTTPMTPDLSDGVVVALDDGTTGYAGNCLVTKMSLKMDKANKILATVEAVRWLI